VKGHKKFYIDAEKKIYSDSDGIIRCEKCGMEILGKLKWRTGQNGSPLFPALHCPKSDPMPGDPK
jgi:hypothetical protein